MIDKEKILKLHFKLLSIPKSHEDAVITEWLEQNQPSLVVGLSDEQLYDFYTSCEDFMGVKMFVKEYKEWEKTQTFAQPNESLIADNLKLAKELEQLKSQQFKPNWDDAPKWANWLAQDRHGEWYWYAEKPHHHHNERWDSTEHRISASRNPDWQQTLQPRPTPMPQIEVGQVWKDKTDSTVSIIGIGKRGKDVIQICYQYIQDNKIEIRCDDDFLAKFEMVS